MNQVYCDSWANDLIGNVTFRGLACGLSSIEKDETYTLQTPFSRFLLGIEEGSSVHISGKREHLSRNRIVIIPAETEATYSLKAGSRFYWLYFHANYAGCINLFRLVRLAMTGRSTRSLSNFKEMIRGFHSAEPSRQLKATSILVDLLAPFLADTDPHEGAPIGLRRLIPAMRYLEEHLADRVKSQDLARLLNVSPRYFGNMFSGLMGTPLTRYLNQRRILKAKEELFLTPLSIKEIAADVGFDDPFYFARTFRKFTGISPTQYRQKHSHQGSLT